MLLTPSDKVFLVIKNVSLTHFSFIFIHPILDCVACSIFLYICECNHYRYFQLHTCQLHIWCTRSEPQVRCLGILLVFLRKMDIGRVLFFSQCWTQFPPSFGYLYMILSPLADGIIVIILMCPDKQMFRINTCGVITSMTN